MTATEKASAEMTTKLQITPQPKTIPGEYMLANSWQGSQKVEVIKVPRPTITDPDDVILKVTSTAICGSDLHLYQNMVPGMQKGDIMGHEFMGIVHEVGPNVKSVKKGDRVVACFDIGCGQCFYCHHDAWSACSNTNPSKEEEALYGHRTAGFYGYSHLTGGYPGGQAQYARVPFADVNTLKVPDHLPDEKVLFLSDIMPTGWNAADMGNVSKGDRVAIWGCGPVGILAAHAADFRGAERIVIIDNQQYRLDFAKKHIPRIETINFDEHKNVPKALHELLGREAPDVGIEAVGLHYVKSMLHKVELTMNLETDPSEILNEIIYSVRPFGRISDVGVYAGYTNHFNIGAFMEKGQTMRGSQTPCQRYWKQLLKWVEEGKLHPDMVITHKLPLKDAPHGYKIFNNKEDGCVKVVLKPWEGLEE